jgi:uncharacterized membrane protein
LRLSFESWLAMTYDLTRPVIRTIDMSDLKDVLHKGLQDFNEKTSHLLFLGILYPIATLVAALAAAKSELLPLVFPLVSGFALIGPMVAVGLYELSRRLEQGLDISWNHAFQVLWSPSIGAIMTLSLILCVIYLAWLGTALGIYWIIFGSEMPESVVGFARQVFTTPAGWTLIIVGVGVGFLFAVVVLAIAAVSFPMLVDRRVRALTAIQTSIRAFQTNPRTMLIWGMIVATLLIAGAIPLFAGLAVVVPVLGHATWHLYRKVVERTRE